MCHASWGESPLCQGDDGHEVFTRMTLAFITLMGETLSDLPAVLDPSLFFAHIFSMHQTIRMQKSGLGQGL